MKVTAVETVPYALTFREPYVTARGRLERREMVLVRIRTDAGIDGLGEAVAMSLRGGPDTPALARQISELAQPQFVGVDLDSDAGRVEPVAGMSPAASAALEIAQLDLAAKLAGMPLWRMLGAESAQPVRCNATLVAGPLAAVAADAKRWAERGFETFKLKVGVPGDVGQVEAVRGAAGSRARLRVDANGVWTPQEAVLRLTAMERHGIELAEQPAGDLEDLAVVRNQTAIPIAADESVVDADDARRAIELGACQLTTVKLAKVGGIEPARAIAGVLPVYLSSALDGPVGIAAAAHLAQVLRPAAPWAGLAHGLATQLLFADTIASVECEVRQAHLHLPAGPGLGIEIDEGALERCRI
ncbi:MAG TPA: mandelate racemase/muconate lactonizing enzyme family protein [Solirubrobacterales bacterium]|nr:mandelate racemase/muconate lactonizing enzyme family protein [Solirubrobacterales bacterium]